MDARTPRSPRPRKLIWFTLALAAATLGLALRGLSPALSPAGVTHVPAAFDLAFGLGGAGVLTGIAARLWRRHRRDSAAAVLALTGWTSLAVGVTLRSALFAQADYERGRLPFFIGAALVLAALTIAAKIAENRAGASH